MVKFSVFNELSLPFQTDQNIVGKFIDFFKLLEELKRKGLGALRVSKEFKNYEILQGINFQQFIGRQQNQDFQRKIKSFLVNNGVVLIESPIVQENEIQEQATINENEYFYQTQSNNSGLACCDVWNALAISFNSSDQWNIHNICLRKRTLLFDGALDEQNINVKHSSKIEHLNFHNNYFNDLEKEIRLNITQEGFWKFKNTFFPSIIAFCPEVESQITNLDKLVFKQAIGILRDVETQRKLITNFSYSRESQTVRNDQKLKEMRMFTIDGRKTFFENHVKSLPKDCRIYFIECDDRVHIGYIGKHLKTS